MNIPQIYLVEPYNAYAPKQKKKHWMQEVEEQALLARIIAEQTAIQEAAKRTSNTLPPQAPETATPTIVGNTSGEGAAGGRGSGAGGGGTPVWDFFNPTGDVVNFSFTPTGGAAPLTVIFTNLTTTPQFDSYLWTFGDGTTSTDANPTHVYQSGSTALSYTCSLQVSNSISGEPGGSTTQYLSASIPVVTAKFTYVTSSAPGPVTASFTNTSTNTSQTPTTTYLWVFGDTTSSSLVSPTHPYANTGSFTASLQATGSYGIASSYTQSFFVAAPVLTAKFTFTTSSNTAPSVATFQNTINGVGGTQYNGHGSLTYRWDLGSGSLTSTSIVPTPTTYTTAGNYTASLQVTESTYGIKSFYTQSWKIA